MKRIQHILLPTDFSDLAVHAAPMAAYLAESVGATLHVLHVFEPPLAPGPETPGLSVSTLATADDARPALDGFVAAHLTPLSAPIVKDLVVGAATHEIVKYVHRHSIDLIVIGTHARGMVKRMFLGSISNAVAERANCAVLMVPLAAVVPDAGRPSGP